MYKISDIFNTDSIKQKRKILSNFPITREDRNKTLVGSMNTSGGGSDSEGKFTYKSRKVVWGIDWDKLKQTDGTYNVDMLLQFLQYLPIYSVITSEYDSGRSTYIKYYGFSATCILNNYLNRIRFNDIDPHGSYQLIAIEENVGYDFDFSGVKYNNNGIFNLLKSMSGGGISDEEINNTITNMLGLVPMDYENFINLEINAELKPF